MKITCSIYILYIKNIKFINSISKLYQKTISENCIRKQYQKTVSENSIRKLYQKTVTIDSFRFGCFLTDTRKRKKENVHSVFKSRPEIYQEWFRVIIQLTRAIEITN